MSSFKKIDLERDFAAGVYLPEAQNPVTPSPLTHCRYLFTQGQTEMSDAGIQMPAASPLMTMSTYEYASVQSSFNFFRMFLQVPK